MTDLPLQIDDSKMYRITEVAEITGYDQRKLRRWANQGYLANARRNGASPTSPFVVPGSTVRKLLEGKTGTE